MRLNAHSIRSTMFRALAAFCGVNLLVALPLAFVIFECIPHRVELAVVEEGHVAIAVSDSRQGDGSVNFCASAELYDIETVNGSEHLFGGDFPCAFDFSAPAFLLRSDDVSNVEIAGLQIIVGDVLCRTLSPEDIASVYSVDGTNLLAVADNGRVGIPLIGGVCRLVPVAHASGVQLLLEAVSWFVLFTPLQFPRPFLSGTLNVMLQNECLFVLLAASAVPRRSLAV